MTKYRPFARRELHALFRRWVSANRVKVGVVTVGAAGLIAFVTWMFAISDLDPALRWYVIGVAQAGIVGVVIGSVGMSFLANQHQAIWHIRGAWGEDFTRDELDLARRRKLIWGWVDSVTLQQGDIDHLVVTKAGGLVAIDSKWRSQSQDVDPAALVADAKRVKLRADGVVHTLVGAQRGSHRVPIHSIGVTPLIVVWGAGQEAVPENARVDGIDLVPGGKLVDWLTELDGSTVDEAVAADLLVRLEEFRSTAWAATNRR